MTQNPSLKEKLIEEYKDRFCHYSEDGIEDTSGDWLDKAFDRYAQHCVAEREEELIKEIIEDIPLCHERFSKCSCADHDINNAVYDYLNTLAQPEVSDNNKNI